MNKVEGGVSTRLRESALCAHTFIPGKATAIQSPTGFVEIEVVIAHIDIDILVQVAIRCTEQQVVDEAVLQEVLLGQVPADGERR